MLEDFITNNISEPYDEYLDYNEKRNKKALKVLRSKELLNLNIELAVVMRDELLKK